MYLRPFLALIALASTAATSVLNVNIYTDSDVIHEDQSVLAGTREDKPGWKKEDELHLVPLVPEARTGSLPADIEEGLVHACKF